MLYQVILLHVDKGCHFCLIHVLFVKNCCNFVACAVCTTLCYEWKYPTELPIKCKVARENKIASRSAILHVPKVEV